MDGQTKGEILQQLGGIPEDFYDELVGDYIRLTSESLEQIKKFASDNDYDNLEKIAHSIKGASGNLRLNEIYEVAVEVDQMAKDEVDMDIIKEKIRLLKIKYEELKTEFAK